MTDKNYDAAAARPIQQPLKTTAETPAPAKTAPGAPGPVMQKGTIDPSAVQQSNGGRFSAGGIGETVGRAAAATTTAVGGTLLNVVGGVAEGAGATAAQVMPGVAEKFMNTKDRLRRWSPEELRAKPDWVGDFKRAAEHLDKLSMKENANHLQDAKGQQQQLMTQLTAIANEVSGNASTWTRITNTLSNITGNGQTPSEKLKVILTSNETLFVSLKSLKDNLETKRVDFIGEVGRWDQNRIDNFTDMEDLGARVREHQGSIAEGEAAIASGELSPKQGAIIEASMRELKYELDEMTRELEVRDIQCPRYDSSIELGDQLVGLSDEMVKTVTSVLSFSLMEIERLQAQVIITGAIGDAKAAALDMLNAIELANHAVNLVAEDAAEGTIRMRAALSQLAETLNARDKEGINAVQASTAQHEKMNNKAVQEALATLKAGVNTDKMKDLQGRLQQAREKAGVPVADKSKHRQALEAQIGD